MSVIQVTNHGELKSTDMFLKTIATPWFYHKLKKYGEMGVEALMEATPVRTGKTQASWRYEIQRNNDKTYSIVWINDNRSEGDHGPPVVVLLYYGHVTRQGGYVEGRDFITPAIRPVFDKIAKDAWKEMSK